MDKEDNSNKTFIISMLAIPTILGVVWLVGGREAIESIGEFLNWFIKFGN